MYEITLKIEKDSGIVCLFFFLTYQPLPLFLPFSIEIKEPSFLANLSLVKLSQKIEWDEGNTSSIKT